MAFKAEQIAAQENKWDIPHLIRQDNNLTQGFMGGFKLSPTAVLPANWEVRSPNSTHAFIWDIAFSSDTAIEVQIGHAFPPGNFTGRAFQSILPTGGPSTVCGFGAQVVAAVGMNLIDGFFIGANQRVQLLHKGWLATDGASSLIVTTSLVAANCYCSFQWCEYTL